METRTVLDEIRKRAEAGDSNGQTALGKLYFTGSEDPGARINPDLESSIHWFKLAAEQGNSEAQFLLAMIFRRDFGGGPLSDVTTSNRWLQTAAACDYPDANHWLGVALIKGQGLKKDKPRGIRLILRAAFQNVPDAQFLTGTTYAIPFSLGGLKYNDIEAHAWLAVAANNDHELAEKRVSERPVSKTSRRISSYRANEIVGKINSLNLLAGLDREAYDQTIESLIELAANGGEHHHLIHARCNGEELITGAAYLSVLSQAPAANNEAELANSLLQAAELHFSVAHPTKHDTQDASLAEMLELCANDFGDVILEGNNEARAGLLKKIARFKAWALKLLHIGDTKMQRLLSRARNNRIKAASILAEHLGPPDSKDVEQVAKGSSYPPSLMRSALSIWRTRNHNISKDEVQARLQNQGEELLECSVLLEIFLHQQEPETIRFMFQVIDVMADLHFKLLDSDYTASMISDYRRNKGKDLSRLISSGTEDEQKRLTAKIPKFLAWGQKLVQASRDDSTGLHEHAWGDREKFAPLLLDYTCPPTDRACRAKAKEINFQHQVVLSILQSHSLGPNDAE